MTKTGTASPPLIVSKDAPGPVMVRDFAPLLSTVSAVLTVMVAGYGRLKLIVSPLAAPAIAARNEPGPLSFVLVTVIVSPKTGKAPSKSSIAAPGQTAYNDLADDDRLIRSPPVVREGGAHAAPDSPAPRCGHTNRARLRQSPVTDESADLP